MAQPEFSQIVAMAARESVIFLDLSNSSVIASNGIELIDVYAPVGTICELFFLRMLLPKPVGATTGTHFCSLTNTTGKGAYLQGTSNFGTDLSFINLEWQIADVSKYPATDQGINVNSLKFDSNLGMRLMYINSTNVSQTGSRTYYLQYLKRVVG